MLQLRLMCKGSRARQAVDLSINIFGKRSEETQPALKVDQGRDQMVALCGIGPEWQVDIRFAVGLWATPSHAQADFELI